jgi:hypothetical protein
MGSPAHEPDADHPEGAFVAAQLLNRSETISQPTKDGA